jgi:hypothetical protein
VENNPFKTKSEDLPKLISYETGQEIFLKQEGIHLWIENFLAGKTIKSEKYVKTDNETWSSSFSEEYIQVPISGDELYNIGSFKNISGETQYLARRDGRGGLDILKFERKLSLGKSESDAVVIEPYKKIKIPDPFGDEVPQKTNENKVPVNLGSGIRLNGFFVKDTNFADGYFAGIREKIKESEDLPGDSEEIKEIKQSNRKKIAYHVLGFGEQAGKFEEKDVQDKSYALAREIAPEEKFEEIVTKRTGRFGGFRSSKEELLNL